MIAHILRMIRHSTLTCFVWMNTIMINWQVLFPSDFYSGNKAAYFFPSSFICIYNLIFNMELLQLIFRKDQGQVSLFFNIRRTKMNGFIKVQEAADKWGITIRQVQALCKQRRIKGSVMLSRIWIIPENAVKPTISRARKVSGTKKTSSGSVYLFLHN